MTTTILSPSEQFFYDYAGWGYTPANETKEQGHIRCAREMAIAADYAKRVGWTYAWLIDMDGCRCDYMRHGNVYICSLRVDETELASLSGICDPDVAYMRVIEADLALEAMPSEELAVAMKGVRS